jgi:hypothetical protein
MEIKLEIPDQSIRDVIAQALQLPAYTTEVQTIPAQPEWIPASQPPTTESKVVVKTKDGCIYFETPRDGKLMKNVKLWYPLPEDDAIRKEAINGKESS